MNKKISQFEVTTSFEDNDILTLIQDKTNKIIHKDDLKLVYLVRLQLMKE